MDGDLTRAVRAMRATGRAVELVVELLGTMALSWEEEKSIREAGYAARKREAFDRYAWCQVPSQPSGAGKLHLWYQDKGCEDYVTRCGLKSRTDLAWLSEHAEPQRCYESWSACLTCRNRQRYGQVLLVVQLLTPEALRAREVDVEQSQPS